VPEDVAPGGPGALAVGVPAGLVALRAGLAGACLVLGADCGLVTVGDAVAVATAVAAPREAGAAGRDGTRARVELAVAGPLAGPWLASLVPLNAPDTSRATMATVARTAALTANAAARRLRRSSGCPPGDG
jgi:hypothetical protein